MVFIKIAYSLVLAFLVLELNVWCDLQKTAETQNLMGYIRAAILCHLKLLTFGVLSITLHIT